MRYKYLIVIFTFLSACQNSVPLLDNYSSGLSNSGAMGTGSKGIAKTAFFEHFWTSRNWLSEHEHSNGKQSELKSPLIIAIEGDGRPWRNRFQIATDPTSARPLLLSWLKTTEHPVLYLGRPCYFGTLQIDPPEPPLKVSGQRRYKGCSEYWFTFGRYSQAVVDSLIQAAQGLANDQCLILVGHSGGGTLAMLMARQLPNVKWVVTMSGNLSVTQWQQHHQFSPLLGSHDPGRMSPLAKEISQLHLAAEQDSQILPEWISREAFRQGAEYQLWSVPGHSQWQVAWSQLESLLKEIMEKTAC